MADNTRTEPRRLWRIVLVISLALNVAVAGAVIGAVLRDKVGGKRPGGIEFGVGPLGEALSREDRRALGRDIRNRVALDAQDRLSPRQTLREIQDALRAEPFDPEALQAIVARTSNRAQRIQAAAQSALVDHVVQMTNQERAAFADRLDEALRRR